MDEMQFPFRIRTL